MSERSHGYKYDEVEQLTGEKYAGAAEIAKLMRKDIAEAVEFGLLPGAPVRYSVTSESYSGGQSIDITVKDWQGPWYACHCEETGEQIHPRPSCLSPEVEAAKMTLERIHGAYNHDGSDIQTDYFDVRYYGQVSWESPDTAAWRAAEKAKRAARRQAKADAEKAGTVRVVVYGRGGSTVHDAVEIDGRLKLLCGAQLWRGSLTGKGEGKDLTCSRCQKREAKR